MLRFSVVVTNYNYGRFVGDAVRSACEQSFKPHEIIVVDDGSTDDSLKLLGALSTSQPSVRIIATANHGQLAAFMTGVKATSGDVVCFLDADDLWDPRYLEALDQVYSRHASVDHVFVQCAYFGERHGAWHGATQDCDHGVSAVDAYFRRYWQGSPTSGNSFRSALSRRALALASPLSEDWRVSADECLVRGACMLGAHQYYLAAPLVKYRVHGSNHWNGRSRTSAQTLAYDLKVQRLIEHLGREVGMSPRSLEWAAAEFKTRPQPTFPELMTYIAHLWGAPRSWFWRLRRIAGMVRYFARSLGSVVRV